jgi:hypothetical protein
VVNTLSAMLSYRLLAYQFGPSHLLAAMVLLTVFFKRLIGFDWIGYYELTALFYLAGAALLFCGLVRHRKLLVLLAGVVLGAGIFVRLPNVLGLALGSAVWLQAWACRWTWREAFAGSAWFAGGFGLGGALIWGLIALHGDGAIYTQSIQAISSLARDAGSHHPGSGLLKRFISDHVRAFAAALPLVVVGGWLAGWVSRQKVFLASAAVSAGALLLACALYHKWWCAWIVPGLCYVVLIAVVVRESRKDRRLALLGFIAGLVLLLAPLGSGVGIPFAVFGMWLALPLSLMVLWRSPEMTLGRFSIQARGLRVSALTLGLALLFQSLASAWCGTWRDSNHRLAMTHWIPHPLLIGTFTTAERAKVVAELLDAMPHFAKPGDEVLACNSLPLLHFLTGTRPWLGDPWPDVVDAKRIAALIRQKEETGAGLPCIVRATGSTWASSWPVAPQPLVTAWHQAETRRVLAEFEQRHGYVRAWANDFFEILTPAH